MTRETKPSGPGGTHEIALDTRASTSRPARDAATEPAAADARVEGPSAQVKPDGR